MMFLIVIFIVFGQIMSASQFDGRYSQVESDRHQPRNARLRYIKNENCRNEIIHLMDGLKKNLPWAMRTHWSSSGYPSGLLHGNIYQLDDYDECMSVHSPNGLIRKKYCIVDVRFSPEANGHPPDPSIDDFDLDHNPYASFLVKFKVTADPRKKIRNTIHTGVCIPESCSPDAVNTLGSSIRDLADSLGYNTTTEILLDSCTDDMKTSNLGEKVVWFVIVALSNLVLLATIWDIFTQNGNLMIMMQPFSLKRNLWNLMTPTKNDEFDALHGMKTWSMLLIILGHRCMTSFGGPVLNADFIEKGYRSFSSIFLLNGILIVDTFFLIGGFLTFIMLHEAYKLGSGVGILTIFFKRWLRITPGYMLTVFFYGYAFENLGSGPLWSAKVGREAERCRLNWWTNFLYINNYINADKLCMFQSWYVACDMHYTIISPAIVTLVAGAGKMGLFILLGSVAASSMTVSAVTYINKYDGVMRIYHRAFEDLASDSFFSEMYIKSHNRIIPYLSGITAAYIYLHLKDSDIKISKLKLWLSSILSLIFGLLSICCAWIFYIPGREYNSVENALFASLHRVLWSISMGWVAVGSSRKCFGKLQPILTNKAYIPFSRLSFGTFLVHGAVQLYITASLREGEYLSYSKLFWMTSGDIVLSFFFALLLHLLVEAPMKGIEKLLLSRSVYINGSN